MSVSISFGLVDVSAKEDSTPTATYQQPFVDAAELEKELSVPPTATLEENYWRLDGAFRSFPDDRKGMGLISTVKSGEDLTYSSFPTLTVTFSENHSSTGITFAFDSAGGWCSYLQLSWYQGDTLLARSYFSPDSPLYVCKKTVENYNKLVVSFQKANAPGRYLKLYRIYYGIVRSFGEDEITSASLLEEVDPISAEVSMNTLNFELYSEDEEFSILNPTGIYTLLQQRQPLEVSESGRNMGTFYLDSWENTSEQLIRMSCVDAVGVLDSTTYRGGIYANQSAGELFADICSSGGFTVEVAASLAAKTLSGWIPISSHREALHQVAFAVGGMVDCSRSGMVRILEPSDTVAISIAPDRKFLGGTVKLRQIVTGVEVTSHAYQESEESEELFNGTLEAGTHEITFQAPHHTLTVTGATLSSNGPNYAMLVVSAAGTVTVTGKKYVDNTQITGVYADSIPAGAATNVIRVENATLVSPAAAPDAAQRLYDYYQLRIEQDLSFAIGDERPGECVSVTTLYDTVKTGRVEQLSTDLIAGTTKAVIVGA